MIIALLVGAKIKTKHTVGTFLAKGRWMLVGGDDIGRRDNNLKSQFSPPLGSITEIESSKYEEVVIESPMDDEIFLYYQRI